MAFTASRFTRAKRLLKRACQPGPYDFLLIRELCEALADLENAPDDIGASDEEISCLEYERNPTRAKLRWQEFKGANAWRVCLVYAVLSPFKNGTVDNQRTLNTHSC